MSAKSASFNKTGHSGAGHGCERLSYKLDVESVPDTELELRLSANEAERAALAAQCGLAGVREFQAEFKIRKAGLGGFKVTGMLYATVTQICVVTLEPFEADVSATIDVDFAAEGAQPKLAPPDGELVSLSAADPPDPIIHGEIDLGALAAEFLVLNLDIYPRKPGAVFEATQTCAEAEVQDSPFTVLRWRR